VGVAVNQYIGLMMLHRLGDSAQIHIHDLVGFISISLNALGPHLFA
jgi:hypothetical protein